MKWLAFLFVCLLAPLVQAQTLDKDVVALGQRYLFEGVVGSDGNNVFRVIVLLPTRRSGVVVIGRLLYDLRLP